MTDTTLIPLSFSASNLRPDETDPTSWRVCGVPRRLRSDSWLPLQRLWLPDIILPGSSSRGADTIFWLSGGTLGVSFITDSTTDPLAAEVTPIATLTASPLCLSIVIPGVIRILMRHSAPIYLTYTSRGIFTLRGAMPVPPPLMFTTSASTHLTQSVPAIPLSGAGLQGGTLSHEDRRRVSSALLAAASALSASASAAGWLIQPVIARYRLEDPNGDTLFLSPPVLLASADGFQLTGETPLTLSADMASTSGGALQARGYALRLLPPANPLPEPWCSLVSRVVVELSDPVDPVEAGGLCGVRVASSGAAATLQVSLPGAAISSPSSRRGLVERALRSSLPGMKVAAVIPSPFGQSFSGADLPALPAVGGVAPSPLSLPTPWREGVSYGVATLADGLLLCASPLTERFPGYSPAHFAVAATSGSWQAVASASVIRPDGVEEVAVATAYGDSTSTCAPAAFSGILTYPDPAARSLTLAMCAPDGSVTRQAFPLTPWPEAGIAYYIDPNGATAILLSGSGGELPVPLSNLSPRMECGVVAVCDPLLPGAPLCREAMADGPVTAILEAPRSSGNWDFSRRRLIVYGSAGTTLMTLSSRMALHSMARLDLRPVSFVAKATGAKGMTHLAIADGDLVEVSASGVTTLLRSCGASSCGRSPSTGEYWLASPSAPPRRLLPSGQLISLSASPFPLASPPRYPSLVNWQGRPLLSLPSSLYDPADEAPDLILPTPTPAASSTLPLSEPSQSDDSDLQSLGSGEIILTVPCDFSIRCRLSSPSRSRQSSRALPSSVGYPSRQLLTLTIPLISNSVNGSLTVSADNGASSSAAPLVTLSISGPLRSPLHLRIPSPLRSHLTITFSGRLSPGSLLSPPIISHLSFAAK